MIDHSKIYKFQPNVYQICKPSMELSKNTSQKKLVQVRGLMSIIEKKLSLSDEVSIEKLDLNELTDFHKILTMCEFVLSKYETSKTTYQNMKKFADILESTIESIELVDGKTDELKISADFSMKKIKEFETQFLDLSKNS